MWAYVQIAQYYFAIGKRINYKDNLLALIMYRNKFEYVTKIY